MFKMSVEIVKRICEDVKEFDNKEDFIKYYDLNKNELKKCIDMYVK